MHAFQFGPFAHFFIVLSIRTVCKRLERAASPTASENSLHLLLDIIEIFLKNQPITQMPISRQRIGIAKKVKYHRNLRKIPYNASSDPAPQMEMRPRYDNLNLQTTNFSTIFLLFFQVSRPFDWIDEAQSESSGCRLILQSIWNILIQSAFNSE